MRLDADFATTWTSFGHGERTSAQTVGYTGVMEVNMSATVLPFPRQSRPRRDEDAARERLGVLVMSMPPELCPAAVAALEALIQCGALRLAAPA